MTSEECFAFVRVQEESAKKPPRIVASSSRRELHFLQRKLEFLRQKLRFPLEKLKLRKQGGRQAP